MADNSPRSSKAPPMSRNPRVSYERDRRHHPHRFVAPDAEELFVENVAELMGCGVDFVRRIPRDQLPASRIGQRLMYLREDVRRYIRTQRDHGTASAYAVNPGSPTAATGRQSKRAPAVITTTALDPVGEVRRLLGKGRVS